MTTLDWPQRTESIEWKVYDVDNNELGLLMVGKDPLPQITNDTTRAIRRNVQSLQVAARPLYDVDNGHYYAGDISTLTMRARPFWVMGDGTRYPLGVYVWGDDSTVQQGSGQSPSIGSLTDLCTVLDQPLDDSIGYAQGQFVIDAIMQVVDDEGLSTDGIENSEATFGVAVGWAAGRDTFLTVLDGLCKNAGFLPPYFDNDGLLRCRPAPNIATASPDFEYGFGDGGVMPGSSVFSNDLMTAPNRYVIIGGNPDAELVGIFDVPASAPNSFANIGRYRRKTDTVQGISTQAQADQAAAAAYASDISTYTWLSFDARAEPRHDTWNIVSYDGINYREVGWTLECKPGGKMSHALRGTYG